MESGLSLLDRVRLDGLEIRLRVEGISSLVEDLRRREPERTAA
jgi:hypothetical protein